MRTLKRLEGPQGEDRRHLPHGQRPQQQIPLRQVIYI